MSCIFCDSFYHLSEFCENYVSDEERNERILSINIFMMKKSNQNYMEKRNQIICRFCLTKNNCGYAISGECSLMKKCYICFSNNLHHTVYCPDRFKAPKWFIPNINQNLFQRFLDMFNADEKYSIAFQSPTVFNEHQLSPLTVFEHLRLGPDELEIYQGSNAFIFKKLDILYVHSSAESHQKIFKNFTSRIWICIAEHLFIDYINFSSTEILMLLSTKTKYLKMGKTKIPLKFEEIFEKAPNLEEGEFTSIQVKNDFISFLKFKYEKNLKKLSITVYREFDIKWLSTIIKKSTKNAEIDLSVDYPTFILASEANKMFTKNYGKYFERIRGRSSNDKKYLSIYLQAKNRSITSKSFIGLFILSKKALTELRE